MNHGIESSTPNEYAMRDGLARTLSPRTVAIVGVSENSPWAASAQGTLDSDAEVIFVHPKFDVLWGKRSYPDLAAIGRPVDAVFSALSAERTVRLVDEAVATGCGGIVTIAGGFAESGTAGLALQERMKGAALAAGLPIIGPNGVGMINVPRRLNLTILPAFERRVGGVSAVTHSGAMLGAIAAAANRAGGAGFNLLISAGNEAVTDIADYLDYLVDDPATRVIVLGIEKIRRPDAFFAAARRAHEAGKPIVAIKLGRSERGMRMAQSHTGTLTGDAWIYEVALKQANIQLALDVDELIDRVQFLDQLPSDKWSAVNGLSVLTLTGGFATMASDIAADEQINMPEVERLVDWLSKTIPGATVPNPLDATGFTGSQPEVWQEILDTYAAAPEFDSYLLLSQFADWDRFSAKIADPFAAVAEASKKAFILSPLAGPPGAWTNSYVDRGVAVGNGIRGSLRGIQTMARFVRSRSQSHANDASEVPLLPRPSAMCVDVPEGRMLPFAATMERLADVGIPIAPYKLLGETDSIAAPLFSGPYVVKLADVAHRTEYGAVKIGVSATDLAPTIDELRALAVRNNLPPLVAIQPAIKGFGEAFVGAKGQTELGPLVVLGLGGIFVEVLKKAGGRLAPFSAQEAAALIDEFTETGLINGFRGQPAWDRDQLTQILVATGRLAAGGREWLASMDINPLIFGPDGFVAVDALLLIS